MSWIFFALWVFTVVIASSDTLVWKIPVVRDVALQMQMRKDGMDGTL